jgi:hypothetical protein
MKDKTIETMTRAEFEALPNREWDKDIGPFDSLVILPSKRKHDSGYRCMDFVAVVGNKAVCRLSGCSDVIHLDGIGGWGKNRIKDKQFFVKGGMVQGKGWQMDCLPKSGLLRVFCCQYNKLTAGMALSSFEVWAEDRAYKGKAIK